MVLYFFARNYFRGIAGDSPLAEGQNGSETYAPNHITLRLRDATAPILLPTSCYFHGGFCNVLIIKMLQSGVWK